MRSANRPEEAIGRQPNVVVMLTDDQGWGDLSLTGNTNLSTPHIDKLARQGAVLDWFFVQPLCAPTRAELLTGRYYPRTGVRGVTQRAECLNLDETTIGDVFKDAGYATGCFGKWHSGSAYPYHPNGRGFDEFYGYCCGHWGHYFDSTLEHNGEEVHASGYLTDSLTDKAMEFMEANRDRPFLCYVPFNTPHSPFQVPDRWFDKFKNMELGLRAREPEYESLDATRSVLAMCENIDWNVGRLAHKVEELGLTEHTIFVYLADNGPNGFRWNGGMSGKKGSADEGGVRSPCFITWQGMIAEGKRVERIAGAIDLLPTLTDLAGVRRETARPIDGVSLKPLLVGENPAWPERVLFAHSPNGRFTSIRTEQYRAGGNSGGLYDMHQDIGQYHDLSTSMPELFERLSNLIREWRKDIMPVEELKRPIPVGYPEFPTTYLNAQDGIPSGGIRWSSIHPNASYFINWNNIEADMKWEVEINSSGLYEVTVMYACREGEQGAELEVSCAGHRAAGRIMEAFDPPLKNGSDRVPRTESYEKAFTPLALGTIWLDSGKGHIRLAAKTIVGEEVCEVRTVKVKLIQRMVT
jgi:arylsulfatase A-like enzyme